MLHCAQQTAHCLWSIVEFFHALSSSIMTICSDTNLSEKSSMALYALVGPQTNVGEQLEFVFCIIIPSLRKHDCKSL